jgi:hypothetical protein
VPPGAHSVVLHFEPAVFRAGLAVSAVTWAGVLFWGLAAGRRARADQRSNTTG